jgi:hypothetical protein
MSPAPSAVTISRATAAMLLPLALDEHARMRARADADPRWAPEALRWAAAVRELQNAISTNR